MIGFSLPFRQSADSLGYLRTDTDDVAIVASDLKSLITTRHGERPMRYEFGCSLQDLLFEQITSEDEMRALVSERIETQVSRHMPYVSISSIETKTHDNAIDVLVKFSIAGRADKVGTVSVTMNG